MMEDWSAELKEVIDEVQAIARGREAGVVLYALSFIIGTTIAGGPLIKSEKDRVIRMVGEVIDDVVSDRHRKPH